MYRLHGMAQSGNAYKVALALRMMQQPFETVFVDFFNGQTRQPEWRATVNPMGEVPVLEDGARRLTQSGVILSHLARRHGRFGGADEDQALEVQRWLFYDNHKFTANFATYRLMKSFGPAAPDPAVMAFLRGRIDAAHSIVDQHLATHRFLVGDAPTIADFSLAGYVFYPPEESGIDIAATRPHIGGWMQRLRELPGWADPYALLPGERIAPRW